MTSKEQAKAITFLRRWTIYSEDWKGDLNPNGQKLREETKEFIKSVEDEDDSKQKKD